MTRLASTLAAELRGLGVDAESESADIHGLLHEHRQVHEVRQLRAPTGNRPK